MKGEQQMRRKVLSIGVLFFAFVLVTATLFVAAPVRAEWPVFVEYSSEVTDVYGRSIYNEFGDQIRQVDAWSPIKLEATVSVNPSTPLPIKVWALFGGQGQRSARSRIIYAPGDYSGRQYFMATSDDLGNDIRIGVKLWVKWKPEGSDEWQVDNTDVQIFNVHIGELP